MTTNAPDSAHQHLARLRDQALPLSPPARRAVDWRLVAALAAVYLIWSSTYLGMKVAIATFPPFVLGSLRFTLAGVLLLAWHLVRGGRLPRTREVLAALPVGLLLFIAGNGFVAIAQLEVASGVTAIVASTTPLWAALIGPLFGERAKAAEWIGVVLGIVGVALLGARAELGSSWGLTLVLLLAPVGWALGSLLARRNTQAPGLSAPSLHMLIGGVGMFVLSPLIGETWPTSISAEAWGIFAYLVVFGSLVAFTAFNWLLRNTRPSLALSYSYVNPALAVLLGVMLGQEPLYETTVAATAILAVAVAVVVKTSVQRRR
jgi:drug/metabolite transporter (DMT)-like permease